MLKPPTSIYIYIHIYSNRMQLLKQMEAFSYYTWSSVVPRWFLETTWFTGWPYVYNGSAPHFVKVDDAYPD